MPSELDSKIADHLVTTAVSSLWALPNEKMVCTRRALRQAFLAIAQEAYGLGFMAGEETRLRESTAPGGAGRPSWMDIRLDCRWRRKRVPEWRRSGPLPGEQFGVSLSLFSGVVVRNGPEPSRRAVIGRGEANP